MHDGLFKKARLNFSLAQVKQRGTTGANVALLRVEHAGELSDGFAGKTPRQQLASKLSAHIGVALGGLGELLMIAARSFDLIQLQAQVTQLAQQPRTLWLLSPGKGLLKTRHGLGDVALLELQFSLDLVTH